VTDSDTFTYDAASRMLTAVSGRYGNTVTYTYDTAGRKSTEALTISGQTYTVSTAYDAAGQVSGYTYPDGKVVGRTYSDRGQLATLVYDGTTIDTRAYDDGGRMTSSSYHNGVSESRTYNNDNTLAGISFTGAAIGNLTYGWDENKNKTSESIGGTMSGYGFDVGGSGYDSEDRLVNWERADSKHYFHRNQQYSTSAITDGSAAVVERYAYSAYGAPTITDASGTTRTTTAIGNRYTYTGREWDETLALYHYRARMYDSVGGRFVSRDPIG
jgi:RHS repeat-associated protein